MPGRQFRRFPVERTRFQASIMIPTLIIYPTIFFLGVVGNICTCIVIVANKSMHNPTNFYLFSLAISDILVLVLGKLRSSNSRITRDQVSPWNCMACWTSVTRTSSGTSSVSRGPSSSSSPHTLRCSSSAVFPSNAG